MENVDSVKLISFLPGYGGKKLIIYCVDCLQQLGGHLVSVFKRQHMRHLIIKIDARGVR